MNRSRSVILATVAALLAGGAAVYFGGDASAATACAPAWSATAVYVGGNSASQNGHNYTAKWWTQNESPATHSGQWDVWADNGACGGTTTPPTTQPTTRPTTTPPTTQPTTPPTTTPPSNGSLPAHFLTGYWQNFYNGAAALKLASVPSNYDLIAVAFADATGTPGAVSFTLDSGLAAQVGGYTDAQFKADIATMHSRGKKVIISVGGQNGTVSVSDSGSATNFANSVYSLMTTYGFDGVDIDLENGINATYMGSALRSLRAKAGANLIITLAPQTIDMQSTGSSYFALALSIKDILTVVHTQYYNSGSMLGCDQNQAYSQGTENFLTALACIQTQGGLRPDQVALGLPASGSAAGGGYQSPANVNAALDCLARGTNCGTFKPPATYPGIRGAMTWSINWDVSNGNSFGNTVKPHLATLP
ncbi:chitinase [Paractinoplanes globisporus]|uniref:chitinase n=1 Tax=Paractinoplanes globisporus TaxID=113565 RepID=A0ABW6WKD1_9ACTN|nr:glycosyl hydrolase family 18 protein [Actinoplanes globisporus]